MLHIPLPILAARFEVKFDDRSEVKFEAKPVKSEAISEVKSEAMCDAIFEGSLATSEDTVDPKDINTIDATDMIVKT